jgi:hypothetical protein
VCKAIVLCRTRADTRGDDWGCIPPKKHYHDLQMIGKSINETADSFAAIQQDVRNALVVYVHSSKLYRNFLPLFED